MTQFLVFLAFVWCVVGTLSYLGLTTDDCWGRAKVNLKTISTAQSIMLHVLTGPLIWFYLLWLLLAKVGPRA